MENLNYKVGYKVLEDKKAGIEAHERYIAAFEAYIYAEDFIYKCLPAENRGTFFIEAMGGARVYLY